MSNLAPGEVTDLLKKWQEPQARERLFAVIYPELKRIAGARMSRERSGHTLQPTALVHEVFLHLVRHDRIAWRSRAHFLAIASEAMRRVLVDYARAEGCQKRGGGAEWLSLDDGEFASGRDLNQILEIDDLLERLSVQDPRAAKVVELRCFGGLTFEEVAETLGVATRTAKRDWQLARAWFASSCGREKIDDSGTVGPG